MDARPLLSTALSTCGEVISAVRPDQFASPTPCDDFDVRDLLAHLLTVIERIVRVGQGADPFAFAPVTADDVGEDAGLGAWRHGVGVAEDAWGHDDALDRVVTLPWMTAPGRIVLLTYLSEVTVHTWDLACATDQTVDFDPDVVATSLAAMHAAMPGDGRSAMLDDMAEEARPPAAPFLDAVAVDASAAPIDRLVAWCGRRP
ncbi:MAG: TIGR03086 family protein [Actinobacteria bacterium]|nr:TIGR03086 family protein [Actinomycetota bacterium]